MKIFYLMDKIKYNQQELNTLDDFERAEKEKLIDRRRIAQKIIDHVKIEEYLNKLQRILKMTNSAMKEIIAKDKKK